MKIKSLDSFGTRTSLQAGKQKYEIFSLKNLEEKGFNLERLPYSVKILLENLVRHEDGVTVKASDIEALLDWKKSAAAQHEIAFSPARVLLQDFTGVPALVDLAAMRDAVVKFGGNPEKINPILPAELVIDHSIQVDSFGRPDAWMINSQKDYERNEERYRFLRWGQTAFRSFKVVPPDTGIVHQVNLEYLARVVFDETGFGPLFAYPDTLVGTDSHTPMINGLGVLGWGVGGIEAEAAMLGQPIPLVVPEVIGVHLHGQLREGVTATDLVLTLTELLRKKGVIGKFVEFFGKGISSLTIADRATLGNMSPEYGATCGIFPIDDATLEYLRLTGRDEQRIALIETYAKAQGIYHSEKSMDAEYSDILELNLRSIEPSLAGPRLPQQRVPLPRVPDSFHSALTDTLKPHEKANPNVMERWEEEGGHQKERIHKHDLRRISVKGEKGNFHLSDGAVVIAAITSCTNTSNPAVMIGAGLLAKKAVERGLKRKPWVKTSLAPGSLVVTEYLKKARLLQPLEDLGFHLVGYGCTTCIGNSGPLALPIAEAIDNQKLFVCALLSGNRNFEGRINPHVRGNYLASPPLVVAYAIAGSVDLDLTHDPLGEDTTGRPVYLREIWPSESEIRETIRKAVLPETFLKKYRDIDRGDKRWRSLPIPQGELFRWEKQSTYVKCPPYFLDMPPQPSALTDIEGARVLLKLGDSVTTDHISPAGSIPLQTPAGQYLIEQGVEPSQFNSYGARRGNHEVMIRGTFANVRIKNQLVPGKEGGWTRHFPDGKELTVFDASMQYQKENVPLLVLAGKEYGSGSSRDWAAKGTSLLSIKAVIARSFERIHRSNLIGMGVLPLEFSEGQHAESLGLTGEETYQIAEIKTLAPRRKLKVSAQSKDGKEIRFDVLARIDTPIELDYLQHGGILYYVLRQLLRSSN